jgi:hypothetical protein
LWFARGVRINGTVDPTGSGTSSAYTDAHTLGLRAAPIGYALHRYLNDFSKALASEVRILLQEVGKLRDERGALQQYVQKQTLLHQRHTNLIKIPIFPPQPPEPHHLQRDRRTDGGQSQAQRSRRLLPRLASQGDSTLIIIKLPPGAKNADPLPLPSLTNSTKSLCPHRAHPRDLLPGPHHLPPMKYPMHPLAQAGAPSSNARSPELGGRAKPQLPPPQPPRHHLPLRPLPSRRRVRNYPRGHSGDVSTPFIFDLTSGSLLIIGSPAFYSKPQHTTCCSRPPALAGCRAAASPSGTLWYVLSLLSSSFIRADIYLQGPEHLRHRERHGIERSCTLVDPGCTHTRFLCRFCKKFCELCFFDTRSTVACSLGVTNSKYVLQLFS